MTDVHPPKRPTVAIVTGAARGIGAAVAKALGGQGHHLAILDRDSAAAADLASGLRRDGFHALPVHVDVADEDSVTNAVEQVTRELGPPAVLVNNAGVLRDNLLFKMSAADWDTVQDVHLRGAFLMSRAAQSTMVESGWGRIVNLSSTSATGNRGQANYAAAKAGIQGLTKTLALELGRFGITVNSVAPGFIATDMTRATAERIGMPFESFVADAAAAIAVRRVGLPEDVANAVTFFTSLNSGFVNGQVLYVSGGPHG